MWVIAKKEFQIFYWRILSECQCMGSEKGGGFVLDLTMVAFLRFSEIYFGLRV